MEYNKLIDHTLLKSDAREEDIIKLCEEAKTYHFASVCVNPTHVKLCKELLKDSDVKVCTVVGFPLGANSPLVKGYETKIAIEDGADEIDMVINIGALKDQKFDLVEEDIMEVVKNANGRTVKVIIEACLLTEEEKVKACWCALKANANFVKTSTGFSKHGATIEDVALMKKVVGDKLEVKAAGGVRSYEDMVNMVKAGATRIGTSSGVKLISGEQVNKGY
ncbi:TPA: deoxyribose-phosphate aldolase [bacterium]|jgi:deoxyribose-phosphate aldolase|nr:deoxyribose-phosphate aldolase [bacterium]